MILWYAVVIVNQFRQQVEKGRMGIDNIDRCYNYIVKFNYFAARQRNEFDFWIKNHFL